MSALKVGINGFGRIGRTLLRAGAGRLEFAGINAVNGSAEELAHLVKYDSLHGTYQGEVRGEGNTLYIDGQAIPISSERDPAQIPWKKWGVDLVLECSGAFKKSEDFQKHLKAGAKKVLISAPAPGAQGTFVYGVNHKDYRAELNIISNASCTTNCLAPLAKVIHESFGIEKALMTTIHSYTSDQRLLDNFHKDPRRARAAGLSMVPTTTGAAKAVGEVLPELAGKMDGISVRVPTPNVSLVDLTAQVSKDVTVESVNEALIKASEGELKGVLACEAAPLVSCDYNGSPLSSTIDLQSTMVTGDRLIKVFSWYDNEYGFSARMVDLALYMTSVES